VYETGLGVEKDARPAYKWFALAARAGDAEASRRRDTVRATLAPGAQSQLDAEIESWRPRTADVAINDTRVAGEAWKQRSR
jgi:localization factor PodJL